MFSFRKIKINFAKHTHTHKIQCKNLIKWDKSKYDIFKNTLKNTLQSNTI